MSSASWITGCPHLTVAPSLCCIFSTFALTCEFTIISCEPPILHGLLMLTTVAKSLIFCVVMKNGFLVISGSLEVQAVRVKIVVRLMSRRSFLFILGRLCKVLSCFLWK